IVTIAKKYPTRFRPSGGGRSLNYRIHNIKPDRVDDGDRAAFIKRAEEIIAKGGVGFGETAALHFSFFDGHPFEETQPDHPLYLLLADLAAKYDVPLDLHVEAVAKKWTVPKEFHKRSPSNPNYVDENLKALERLLAHNPKAKIIWVHLGMDSTDYRSPALTRRLLATYPNLNISITGSQHARKYWLMIGGFRINPEWKDVIVAFPDRFMIGADTFYQPENTDREFPQNIKRASKIVRLPLLPPAVARKVAFENAQRLFKIKLINADDYPLPGGSLQMSRPKGMAGKGKFSEQVEKRMRNMDADGDGRVARSEFTGPPNNFARIDADKDGFLTAQEFDAFLKKAKAHRAGGAQKTKLKQGGGGPIKAPNGKTAAQIIGNSDQDGDGKLSRAEFQGNPRAFPKIDKNKDGLLTKQEFETFWRFLKAKQGG
ncbi:MAG: EF-hand domain-containing protein, partial [Rhodospirillales bacterium]|nr:EF-hand domain-containing protein [Rhodospirillales bacterium]